MKLYPTKKLRQLFFYPNTIYRLTHKVDEVNIREVRRERMRLITKVNTPVKRENYVRNSFGQILGVALEDSDSEGYVTIQC